VSYHGGDSGSVDAVSETASMGDSGDDMGNRAPCGASMTCASPHQDAVMLQSGVRTTIDLPDDLHKQALAIARDTRRTLSETVAELMRRGLGVGRSPGLSTDPRTGLPLVSVGTVVTSEDVRSLEDEE